MKEIRRLNFRHIIGGGIGKKISQAKMSALLDVSPSYVNQMFHGIRPIYEDSARDYEKKIGLDHGWFDIPHWDDVSLHLQHTYNYLSGEERLELPPNAIPYGKFKKGAVPLLSAQEVIDMDSAFDNSGIQGPKMVDVSMQVSSKAFAFKYCGDSMSPLFADGEEVVIEPALTPSHENYILVNIGGDICIRQYWREAGEWKLKPLSGRYDMLPAISGHIIGVCIHKGMSLI